MAATQMGSDVGDLNAQKVDLSLDTQNYTEQQREVLAQAFRSHGFEAQAYRYKRRTIEELPGLVRIAIEGLSMYPVYKVLDEVYDAWLKPILKETLFKPRNRNDAPILQLEAEDAEAVIVAANESELAVALDLLGEVIERGQPFWGRGNLQLTYRDGKWEIWPDITEPEAYIYDPEGMTFTRISK